MAPDEPEHETTATSRSINAARRITNSLTPTARERYE